MILNIIIVSLFVFGVKSVFNGFFDFFDFDLMTFYERQNKFVQFILRPTIYCNVCMSSFWGSLGYYLTFSEHNISTYVLTVVSCTTLIQIITKQTTHD